MVMQMFRSLAVLHRRVMFQMARIAMIAMPRLIPALQNHVMGSTMIVIRMLTRVCLSRIIAMRTEIHTEIQMSVRMLALRPVDT